MHTKAAQAAILQRPPLVIEDTERIVQLVSSGQYVYGDNDYRCLYIRRENCTMNVIPIEGYVLKCVGFSYSTRYRNSTSSRRHYVGTGLATDQEIAIRRHCNGCVGTVDAN